MRSRIESINELIRATYMQPQQIEAFLKTSEMKASSLGKKVKVGNDLDQAIEKIKSDDFINSLTLNFDELSTEEIQALTTHYKSDPMKKFNKIAKDFDRLIQEIEKSLMD